MPVDYQRTRAHIVKAGTETAHLVIPAWCHGQITVSVLTLNVMADTGLAHDQLPGADLIVSANLAAVTDTEIDVHAFQVADDASRRRRRARERTMAPTTAGAIAFLYGGQ